MSVYEATLECLSDFVYGRGSWTQIGEYKKLNDTNITRVSGIWKSFFISIRCANLVMRVFVYFHLVRNWGGVPETGGFPFGGAYAIYGDLTNPVY